MQWWLSPLDESQDYPKQSTEPKHSMIINNLDKLDCMDWGMRSNPVKTFYDGTITYIEVFYVFIYFQWSDPFIKTYFALTKPSIQFNLYQVKKQAWLTNNIRKEQKYYCTSLSKQTFVVKKLWVFFVWFCLYQTEDIFKWPFK